MFSHAAWGKASLICMDWASKKKDFLIGAFYSNLPTKVAKRFEVTNTRYFKGYFWHLSFCVNTISTEVLAWLWLGTTANYDLSVRSLQAQGHFISEQICLMKLDSILINSRLAGSIEALPFSSKLVKTIIFFPAHTSTSGSSSSSGSSANTSGIPMSYGMSAALTAAMLVTASTAVPRSDQLSAVGKPDAAAAKPREIPKFPNTSRIHSGAQKRRSITVIEEVSTWAN